MFAWRDHDEDEIPAAEVARIDRANIASPERGADAARQHDHDRAAVDPDAPAGGHAHEPLRGAGGPAPKRIFVGYGFWIFLLSDIVMFSAFFAAYAVLAGADRGRARRARSSSTSATSAIETGCLLLSSFTCGLASIAAGARNSSGSTSRWR